MSQLNHMTAKDPSIQTTHITMVKKKLSDGRDCDKCIQAENLLRSNGHWPRIDEVVWAKEGEPDSPGMVLAARFGISVAPFFIVKTADGGEQVLTSVLQFVKRFLKNDVPALVPERASEVNAENPIDVAVTAAQLAEADPQAAMNFALKTFGRECAISFSGAEDVMLIELAARSGLPFSVFSLDTGRLHPETYEFIERVREHYGITIEVYSPDVVRVEELVRSKGLFSFYKDGHHECCSIRKVEPLRRALSKYRMWVTGQRRDQSPTRTQVEVLQVDTSFQGAGAQLLKLNPLARLSLAEVWRFIRDAQIPHNKLHDQGYISIGCAPCTRAVGPGEHERAGRWSWEDATKRECGLHIARPQGT